MQEKTRRSGLKKADRAVFKITEWASWIGGIAVGLAMLISVVDVILIKVFGSAFPSAHEWVTYLNIAMIFPALAFVEMDRGHTDVRLFDHVFPPIVTRIIRIFSLVLATAVMAFLTWRGFSYMLTLMETGEMSSTYAFQKLMFPLWPFALIYALGSGLCCIAFAWTTVRVCTGMSVFGDPPLKKEVKEANNCE